MGLNKVLESLNTIRHIAISDEIIKHDLKKVDSFMNCFYKLVNSSISHVEAYLKIEEIYKEKHGENKYKNFESFRQTKNRWIKNQKS